ncbi:MAG: hypothetical protein U5L11_00265 [Arhodomonas sp.]|nr:hypothetical protein [Arhodomonas sp.]
MIWVASLFSHLPEGLFHQWLERLLDLLTPRGMLCFSVHDEALIPDGLQLPASGLLYGQGSENAELDPAIYGTTFVSEGFVRDAIGGAVGVDHPYWRLPKALAHQQDVYVVARDGSRDLSALSRFRRGPWGWVDEKGMDPQGVVSLRGWAASLDDGPLEEVEIRLGGRLHRVPVTDLRGDVAEAFHDERLRRSGWRFRHTLPPGTRKAYLEITARSREGEAALLFCGYMPPGSGEDRSSGAAAEKPAGNVPPGEGWGARVRRWLGP